MSPSSDPRLIRAVLEFAESHGPVITARKFGIDHTTVYRWQAYRARLGAAWPTDQDVAHWLDQSEARRKNADRKRRYEHRVYLTGGPMLADATGSIRRLQALSRIGWTMSELGAQPELRVSSERVSQIARGRHSTLTLAKIASIRALYDRLTGRNMPLPTGSNADRARRLAEQKGWASPLAWDDDEIDDPKGRPVGMHDDHKAKRPIDESAIQRRIDGDRTAKTRGAENYEVVRRLLADGWSLNAISRHTGLKPERYMAQIRAEREQVAA